MWEVPALSHYEEKNMETSNNSGKSDALRHGVSHPYLRRELATAHQAFLLGFYSYLAEIDVYAIGAGGYVDDRFGPHGHFDAVSPAELFEALEEGDRAYENSLFRSRRIRR